MREWPRYLLATVLPWVLVAGAPAALTEIRMASGPSLSADGTILVFEWGGDIWASSPHGGEAKRLTASTAHDSHARVSPDGRRVAFCSDRSGNRQVYVMPIEGGSPSQVTVHSAGATLQGWSADGTLLLVKSTRDHAWTRADRLWLIDPDGMEPERLAFDAYAATGSFDGDGTLLTRLGVSWWRQGYQGPRASQVWRHDSETGEFERLLADRPAVRSPLRRPSTRSLIYLDNESGVFNLRERDADGSDRQLTEFEYGAMVSPTLATEADVVVFRQLFDLYRLDLTSLGGPEKISLVCRTDTVESVERKRLEDASEVAFSPDGLEIAFIAGGDLWVMDTVLREPRQITNTPGPETGPCFSPDGEEIAYVAETDGTPDVWLAARRDPSRHWWRNDRFELRRLTDDASPESGPRFSPSGDRIAFGHGPGQIRVVKRDGSDSAVISTGWDMPTIRWSPDGQWIGYSSEDSNYNRDVFVVAADGSGEPINVSRHPDDDGGLCWAPDGSAIAFTGVREDDETDIFIAHLTGPPPTDREDRLAEALQLVADARSGPDDSDTAEPAAIAIASASLDESVIRISNPNVRESQLIWSPDSKRIAFSGWKDGSRDTYLVSAAGDEDPERLSDYTGSHGVWIDDEIHWLSGGDPARLDTDNGKQERLPFKAYQLRDRPSWGGAVLLSCWRLIRDTFYDPAMHGVDWTAVRDRYLPMAQQALDDRTLGHVVRMMLGELNASHQGLTRYTSSDRDHWRPETGHLGCWFDSELRITDATPEAERAGLSPGRVIRSVDGVEVSSPSCLIAAMTGPPGRSVSVESESADGEIAEHTVFPISYGKARDYLYKRWVDSRGEEVDRLSDGRLGYLHIRAMNATSLKEFESDLFAATYNRDGLVIDVRFNPGGWITDRLLSMLSHPRHAIATPRGGRDGYPHHRTVYATWPGPLVVLCNESSVSNAEIFSHAIKSSGRGRLVGQPTAGDVISASSRSVAGFGRLRLAFRGWRVASTGAPMEAGPAQPDLLVAALPGDTAAGIDRQLEAAVADLLSDLEPEATETQMEAAGGE